MRYRLGQLALAGSLSFAATTLLPAPAVAQQSQTVTVSRVPVRSGATGWLGLGFQYQERGGNSSIRIGSVWKGAPAERAGLRSGDLLLEVNGVPARMELIQSLLARMAPGDPVSLTVRRGSSDLQLALQADPRPPTATLVLEEMQTQLDSVRRVITGRLDSLGGPRTGSLPVLRVRPIAESDTSVTLFVVVESSGGAQVEVSLDSIRANHMVWSEPVQVRVEGGGSAFTIGSTRELREVQSRADVVRVMRDAPPAASPTATRVVGSNPPQPAGRGSLTLPPSPFMVGLNRVAGAALQEVDHRLEVYLGVAQGLLVTEVSRGTPAADAGLKSGDIVVEADSTVVTTIEELRRILSVQSQGHDLTILRNGARRSIALRR